MGVRAARGTLRRMRKLRDQCLLRIVGAADRDAARAVLARLDVITAEVASREHAVSFSWLPDQRPPLPSQARRPSGTP
jgi:hypothetical protein